MDADVRLAAAAGGAARYFADSSGLENERILALQSAVVSACEHCFTCHTSASHCGVTLERFDDRLEVRVSLPGKQNPEGKEKPSLSGVDEIHCEFLDDASSMLLVKFLPAKPAVD